MPIGTLTQKMNCQLRPSTIAPPTSGPSAMARPAIAPHAPSARPRRFRHGVGEDREGQGEDDRGAEALEGPGEDEGVAGRGERRERRRSGEQGDADGEHPLAPEPVAERGAGQQEDREGQRVGVDGPLELGQRGAQGVLDHRQRRDHDEVVERGHEQRDRADREGRDGQPAGGGLLLGHGIAPFRGVARRVHGSLVVSAHYLLRRKGGRATSIRLPPRRSGPGEVRVVELHRGRDIHRHPWAKNSRTDCRARPTAPRRGR